MLPERLRAGGASRSAARRSSPIPRCGRWARPALNLRAQARRHGIPSRISLSPLETQDGAFVFGGHAGTLTIGGLQKVVQAAMIEAEAANRWEESASGGDDHEIRHSLIERNHRICDPAPGRASYYRRRSHRLATLLKEAGTSLLAILERHPRHVKIRPAKMELESDSASTPESVADGAISMRLRSQAALKGLELRSELGAKPAELGPEATLCGYDRSCSIS